MVDRAGRGLYGLSRGALQQTLMSQFVACRTRATIRVVLAALTSANGLARGALRAAPPKRSDASRLSEYVLHRLGVPLCAALRANALRFQRRTDCPQGEAPIPKLLDAANSSLL